MPTSKDKSVRGGNWVYRPYFRTKGGRIIRASDYGTRHKECAPFRGGAFFFVFLAVLSAFCFSISRSISSFGTDTRAFMKRSKPSPFDVMPSDLPTAPF